MSVTADSSENYQDLKSWPTISHLIAEKMYLKIVTLWAPDISDNASVNIDIQIALTSLFCLRLRTTLAPTLLPVTRVLLSLYTSARHVLSHRRLSWAVRPTPPMPVRYSTPVMAPSTISLYYIGYAYEHVDLLVLGLDGFGKCMDRTEFAQHQQRRPSCVFYPFLVVFTEQ